MSDKLMLAISTSAGVAQVCATTLESDVVFEYEITEYKQQSARLLPELNSHMSANQLSGSSFTGIAVNVGPGGFTSLRTACGVAQGLSVAWGLPCYPVSSFEVMLQQAQADGFSMVGQGLVLIDARLQEFYAARCMGLSKAAELEQYFLLSTQEDLASPIVSDSNWVLVDQPSQDLLSHWDQAPKCVTSKVCATALASKAWKDWTQGVSSNAQDCQPLYVREKVADTTAERLAIKNGKN